MSVTKAPDLERLLGMAGQVIEPVRLARDDYRYFRGLHLGVVYANFLRGIPTLNINGNTGAHFSTSYDYAFGIARSQTEPNPRHTRQFNPTIAAFLGEVIGHDPNELSFPSMVVALDRGQEAFLEPGYNMDGETFRGSLTLHDIDPYSSMALAELLTAH